MIVVADTGPINYIAQLHLTDLLVKLYQNLLLPPAVWGELRHPSAPAPARLWAQQLPAWVRVQVPTSLLLDRTQGLDAGEREAISLAFEVSAATLLIDERRARRIAEGDLHLNVTGTLGVLRNAHLQGWLDAERKHSEGFVAKRTSTAQTLSNGVSSPRSSRKLNPQVAACHLLRQLEIQQAEDCR